jgi:Flp pilus assembly protein TadG
MRFSSHAIRRRRRGSHILECALVCPLLILMSIGTLVVGMGVFRYQQTASLAREGSRWASVRGWQYQHDLNPYGKLDLPMAATPQDVRDHIASQAILLNTSPDALNVQVTWNTDNKQAHTLLDAYGTPQVDSSGNVILVGNVVTVKVTYNWTPEVLSFLDPVSLSSTSTIPMSY